MATDHRCCYSFWADLPGAMQTRQTVWVVASSLEFAEAHMLMECTEGKWAAVQFKRRHEPGRFERKWVDVWVGGKGHGD